MAITTRTIRNVQQLVVAGITEAYASTRYAAKAATEAALGRVDPGSASGSLQARLTAAAGSYAVVPVDSGTIDLAGATLTIPADVTVVGRGMGKTTILGRVNVGSGATVRDLTIDGNGTASYSTIANGARDIRFERVEFTRSSGVGFYLNDTNVEDCHFVDCLFTNHVSNGVQIVDKGTAAKHYENITFTRCHFSGNGRMNFECIQRDDGASYPVVLGYRNISLYDCVFDSSANINVSYDSQLLTDGSARSSGYSTVQGCRITGGTYGLELAGAIEMAVIDNDIRDTTDFLLSTSQVENGTARNRYINNRLNGTGSVVFQGADNIIVGNIVKTSLIACRMNPAKDNLVVGNHFETTGATCVSLESAAGNTFDGNLLIGGSNQVVLNIYAASVGNAFLNNAIRSSNVVFDTRDSTTLTTIGNLNRHGSATDWTPWGTTAMYSSLPTAVSKYRGDVICVKGAAGAADKLYTCLKGTADTYAWYEIATAV